MPQLTPHYKNSVVKVQQVGGKCDNLAFLKKWCLSVLRNWRAALQNAAGVSFRPEKLQHWNLFNSRCFHSAAKLGRSKTQSQIGGMGVQSIYVWLWKQRFFLNITIIHLAPWKPFATFRGLNLKFNGTTFYCLQATRWEWCSLYKVMWRDPSLASHQQSLTIVDWTAKKKEKKAKIPLGEIYPYYLLHN